MELIKGLADKMFDFCEHCEDVFESKPGKKFCSRKCKVNAKEKRQRESLRISKQEMGLTNPNERPLYFKLDPTSVYRNYEKSKLISRRNYARKVHGLTLEEADKLRASITNCPICETDAPPGRDKRFVIDHCRILKKFRGVICNNCNQGIGFLKHDVGTLERAIEYLKKFNEGL